MDLWQGFQEVAEEAGGGGLGVTGDHGEVVVEVEEITVLLHLMPRLLVAIGQMCSTQKYSRR